MTSPEASVAENGSNKAFEITPPDAPEAFKPYLEATAHRVAPDRAVRPALWRRSCT